MRRDHGFTLAELLITVAIILVLVAIAIPVFSGSVATASEATCNYNAQTIVRTYKYALSLDKSITLADILTNSYDGGAGMCPDNGTYSANTDPALPAITCSKHGTGEGGGDNDDKGNAYKFDSLQGKDSDHIKNLNQLLAGLPGFMEQMAKKGLYLASPEKIVVINPGQRFRDSNGKDSTGIKIRDYMDEYFGETFNPGDSNFRVALDSEGKVASISYKPSGNYGYIVYANGNKYSLPNAGFFDSTYPTIDGKTLTIKGIEFVAVSEDNLKLLPEGSYTKIEASS